MESAMASLHAMHSDMSASEISVSPARANIIMLPEKLYQTHSEGLTPYPQPHAGSLTPQPVQLSHGFGTQSMQTLTHTMPLQVLGNSSVDVSTPRIVDLTSATNMTSAYVAPPVGTGSMLVAQGATQVVGPTRMTQGTTVTRGGSFMVPPGGAATPRSPRSLTSSQSLQVIHAAPSHSPPMPPASYQGGSFTSTLGASASAQGGSGGSFTVATQSLCSTFSKDLSTNAVPRDPANHELGKPMQPVSEVRLSAQAWNTQPAPVRMQQMKRSRSAGTASRARAFTTF